jgi:hypothetical protein
MTIPCVSYSIAIQGMDVNAYCLSARRTATKRLVGYLYRQWIDRRCSAVTRIFWEKGAMKVHNQVVHTKLSMG